MADQGQRNEYDQYAPQTNGRLFSNSMFGFNKEEVLEYLEELADENNQRQDSAEQSIRELDMQIKNLEARAAVPRVPEIQAETEAENSRHRAELETAQRQLTEVVGALDVARIASQQAEAELAEFKEQLFTAQKENNWLREEYQKTDKQVAELRRQLDDASQGQWFGAEEQIAELRRQMEEAMVQRDAISVQRDAISAQRDAISAERDADGTYTDSPVAQAAAALIAEATAEAERIRESAYVERDRIHRQILNSAGGLSESIGSLREDISGVEGDVTGVLENVQETLSELLISLSHTEQSLTTLGIQADRFPTTSPAVPKQSAVYFQPGAQVEPERPQSTRVKVQPARVQPARVQPDHQAQSLGSGGFRRVWPEDGRSPSAKTQLFRPTFTNGPGSGAYLTQAAQSLPYEDYDSEEERLRALTNTLVDTLRQMMD